MQLINTKEISGWPKGVWLGYSELKENLPEEILSAKEKEEYQQFTNDKRKQEYLTARHLFRMLAGQLGVTPDSITLKKEEKGKPYAETADKHLYVSFSHSKNLVMAAVSEEKDIGLDVESTNRIIDQKIVRRILNEHEWDIMGEEDPIKLWTIKEAAVKSLGTGLRTNLKDLTIRREGKSAFLVIFNDEISFRICSFQQLNHQIALAY